MKSRCLRVPDLSTASKVATSDAQKSLASSGHLRPWPGESCRFASAKTHPRLGFAGQFIYFLQQAGVSTADSFSFNLGSVAMGFVGTIASWFLMNKYGRRTIMVWGTFGLTALYVAKSDPR